MTLADPQIRTAGRRRARPLARHRRHAPGRRGTTTLAHHEQELDAVFRRGWCCVGVVDDVARPGYFMAVQTGPACRS